MWYIIGSIAGKLLDPIGFFIVLFISFLSRKKWIIPIAAIIAAVATETLLTSSQYTRIWGEGIVYGLIASGLHALICYWIIGAFKKKKIIKESNTLETDNTEQSEFDSHLKKNTSINSIVNHLKVMGYDIAPYGSGVALLEIESGYNDVETASHIALTTMALDITESEQGITKLMSFMPHAHALLKVLKDYKDKKMINPTQWQNDTNAIFRISTVDEYQKEWIQKILSDPIAGKERLAISRINYTP
ncbi:MAG: hypothetical protein QM504_14095 [Pseudomonadota bacterium]